MDKDEKIDCKNCIYYNDVVKCDYRIGFPVKDCANYTPNIILNPKSYKKDLPKICETCEYYIMNGYCGMKRKKVLGKSICDKYEQADYNQEIKEGRFKEIISIQKIKDTKTGIQYDGLIDGELLNLINEIDELLDIFKEQHEPLIKEKMDRCKIITKLQDSIIKINEGDSVEAENILKELIKQI